MKRLRGLVMAIMLITVLMILPGCGKTNTVICKVSISCHTIVENIDDASESAKKVIPEDGIILEETEVEVPEGSTVYDALKKICKEKGIIQDSQVIPGTGDAYVKGIGNIYEMDCGNLSGWLFMVNGELSDKGCSSVTVSEQDVIEWQYTCDMGEDLK